MTHGSISGNHHHGNSVDLKQGKYNSLQNPGYVARRQESNQKREASARSHKSGISDVVSNKSKRGKQQNVNQPTADPNMILGSNMLNNRRSSRNGGLNTQAKTDQVANRANITAAS